MVISWFWQSYHGGCIEVQIKAGVVDKSLSLLLSLIERVSISKAWSKRRSLTMSLLPRLLAHQPTNQTAINDRGLRHQMQPCLLKSVNLQYSTLGHLDDGTNKSSTNVWCSKYYFFSWFLSKFFAKILSIYFLIFL